MPYLPTSYPRMHPLPALACKTAGERDRSGETKRRSDPGEDDGGRRILRCRDCKARITTHRARIIVDGSHLHTFCNPHGLVFDIGCFGEASGCVCVGPASEEFSWFPGHAWRIGLCAVCAAHLGWRFESGGAGKFYGLILDQLEESEEPE